MTITAIFGPIGAGKSWLQLEYALRTCEKKKKKLVSNFFLNLDALYRYCCIRNYRYIISEVIDKCGIIYINSNQSLASLLSIPQSVVCLDEAGVFLNSRQFQSTPKQLLNDLCQSRKDGVDLIYAAQFTKQVDAQIRSLTQFVYHCKGNTIYNYREGRPELVIKNFHLFEAEVYDQWITSRHRNNPIKTRFAFACESQTGALSIADKQLFKCFQSLSRLDKQRINSIFFNKGKYQPVKYRYEVKVNLNVDEASIVQWEQSDNIELNDLIKENNEDNGKMDSGDKLNTPEKDAIIDRNDEKIGVGLFSMPTEKKPNLKKGEAAEYDDCIILVSQGRYGEEIKKWDGATKAYQILSKFCPATSKPGIIKLCNLIRKLSLILKSIKA